LKRARPPSRWPPCPCRRATRPATAIETPGWPSYPHTWDTGSQSYSAGNGH